MAQPQGGGKPKWVWGCGIGCLLTLIVIIALAALAYFAAQRALGNAGKTAAGMLQQRYATLKSENKIPADQVPLYDELAALAQQENASFWTVAVVSVEIERTLEDGEVTADELKSSQEVRDFFKANPGCSATQYAAFVKTHSQYGDAVRQVLEEAGKQVGAKP